MDQSIRIATPPSELDPDFAAVLAGLTVTLRPHLVKWAEAVGQEKRYYFLRSSDVLAALTNRIGVSEATRYNPYLTLGRPIRILCAEAELIPVPIAP